MTDQNEHICPQCGQRLRFPANIGGMLMKCPSCGQKFRSDFKLGYAKNKGAVNQIFTMPSTIMDRISRYFSS